MTDPTPEARDWYRDSVSYFRGLGFFADKADLSDAALADWVMEQVVLSWDIHMTPEVTGSLQAADMHLLMTDRARIWYGDLEYVYPGTIQTLVETVGEWGAISRGAFQPTDITEIWHTQRGPVDIDFTLAGKRQRLVHDGSDILDIGMLGPLNRMIRRSGLQFEVCDNLGMPNFVVVLNAAEKRRLQAERGWTFVTLRG